MAAAARSDGKHLYFAVTSLNLSHEGTWDAQKIRGGKLSSANQLDVHSGTEEQ